MPVFDKSPASYNGTVDITLIYLYRSSDSSDITSLEVRDPILHQRKLSTVIEMETPFKYDIMIIVIVN